MKANSDVIDDFIQVERDQTNAALSKRPNQLPTINTKTAPGASKFSSWGADKDKQNAVAKKKEDNFMDEVDELLLEQELLSPTAVEDTLKSMTTRNQSSPSKINLPGANPVRGSKTQQTSPKIQGASVKQYKNNDESLRDSTLEKLLNGEENDLLKDEIVDQSAAVLNTSKLPRKENPAKDADLIDDDFDLENSDEIKKLIGDADKNEEASASWVLSSNNSESHPVKKYNTATHLSEAKDDIEDLVEEELRKSSEPDYSTGQTKNNSSSYVQKAKTATFEKNNSNNQ